MINEFKPVPFQEYLGIDMASSSVLKTILNQSPAHSRVKKEQTPAMALGSAAHRAVLEPDLFKNEYAVAPKCDKRTKKGKAEFAEFEESAAGKTVISFDDMILIQNIEVAVRENKTASLLLSDGQAEISGFFTDPIENVPCKIRPDFLHKNGMIIDLKTCQDASPAGFGRQVITFGYDLQSSFYSYGFEQITGEECQGFYFVAVEKSEPYGCCVYPAEYNILELGKEKLRRALKLYAECERFNVWPGYPEASRLDVPGWAFK